MTRTIQRLDAAGVRAALPDLVAILDDAVRGGASVGFVLPFADGELEAYWTRVAAAVEQGEKLLFVAHMEGRLCGTVQLAPEARANGAHRAEIQKLLVLGAARRRGVGEALMRAAEGAARQLGRTLLVLDTREGDSGERLYRRLGFLVAGTIPCYARSIEGVLEGSTFMYKLLDEG